jgi:hypothetical protein
LRKIEKRVLREVFESMREELTIGRRKLDNEELHSSYINMTLLGCKSDEKVMQHAWGKNKCI